MNDRDDELASKTENSGPAKKVWRKPKMETSIPIPQTANSKTFTPSDSYVNPNVS